MRQDKRSAEVWLGIQITTSTHRQHIARLPHCLKQQFSLPREGTCLFNSTRIHEEGQAHLLLPVPHQHPCFANTATFLTARRWYLPCPSAQPFSPLSCPFLLIYHGNKLKGALILMLVQFQGLSWPLQWTTPAVGCSSTLGSNQPPPHETTSPTNDMYSSYD